MTKEYRTFGGALDVRSLGETDSGDKTLSGYFVKYNSPAKADPFDFFEQVAPGCFDASLAKNDIMALYNHDSGFILGRQSAGTLVLENRSDGLYGTITVNHEDTEAMNIYSRVSRGDVSGCSFGAWISDEPYEDVNGTVIYTIKEAELVEVSVTPYPFYPDTTMEARNAQRAKDAGKLKAFRSKMFEFKKKKLGEKLKHE